MHGDYQDTRVKNTPTELSRYPAKLSRLLDRVLDEYGVIVSGWSGVWDLALRDAFARCASRRYSTYWTTVGDPVALAQDVIGARKAQVVEIQSADAFFEELLEKVMALEDSEEPGTLSKALAVAMVKRYLPDPQARIRLHDLITNETNRVCKTMAGDVFSTSGHVNADAMNDRVKKYDSALELLESLFAYGVFWDRDNEQCAVRAGVTGSGRKIKIGSPVSMAFPDPKIFFSVPASLVERFLSSRS